MDILELEEGHGNLEAGCSFPWDDLGVERCSREKDLREERCGSLEVSETGIGLIKVGCRQSRGL